MPIVDQMEFEGKIFNIQPLIIQYEKNKMIIYSEKIKTEENNYKP